MDGKSTAQRNEMTMTRNQNCWSLDGCFSHFRYKATVPRRVKPYDSMAGSYLIYIHFEESNLRWIPLVTFPSGIYLLLEQYLGNSNFKKIIHWIEFSNTCTHMHTHTMFWSSLRNIGLADFGKEKSLRKYSKVQVGIPQYF